MVAGAHRHLHAGLTPPVEPGTDGEHNAVLRWRLVRAGSDDKARVAHAIGFELLDHDAIKKWT